MNSTEARRIAAKDKQGQYKFLPTEWLREGIHAFDERCGIIMDSEQCNCLRCGYFAAWKQLKRPLGFGPKECTTCPHKEKKLDIEQRAIDILRQEAEERMKGD